MEKQLLNKHACNAALAKMLLKFMAAVKAEPTLYVFCAIGFVCLWLVILCRGRQKVKIKREFYSDFDTQKAKEEMCVEMRRKGVTGNIDFEIEVDGTPQMEEYKKVIITATGLKANRRRIG